MGKFFHDQAVEEAGHAQKIMTFLIDNEVAFTLPAIGAAPTTYGSAREAVEIALASEVRVSGQFDKLAEAAREAGDHRSLQFLQWFIGEQVEEERRCAACWTCSRAASTSSRRRRTCPRTDPRRRRLQSARG